MIGEITSGGVVVAAAVGMALLSCFALGSVMATARRETRGMRVELDAAVSKSEIGMRQAAESVRASRILMDNWECGEFKRGYDMGVEHGRTAGREGLMARWMMGDAGGEGGGEGVPAASEPPKGGKKEGRGRG